MIGDALRLVLLANVAATLMLTGLIWFVQVVHYPLFARVGLERFAAYEAAHVRATGRVVGLPMIVEAITSAVLAGWPPAPELALVYRLGLLLVVLIWVSTVVVQVPKHEALGAAFDPKVHGGLVRTNWIRTAAWSARGVLVLYALARLLGETAGGNG